MYGDERRTLLITGTAAFIALMAVGANIVIPMFPVPITLQTLFVLLAGAVMKRYAVIPVILYVILGIAGLPVFHQFASGPGVLMGPTGGYMAAFIPAVVIVGLAYERKNRNLRILSLVFASMLILFCGTLWISVSSGITVLQAAVVGFLPFVFGDLIKSGAAFIIAERLDER
ncbi:biotin transporter BioY [Methanoplanus endosymbiosus]|uniref:Biotin transporter BioY n=2 Tax=Methanoplanus endosymbiosus TaxID=33865 RepID=A0A9E7PPA1_9EURY|nr:biotin transporter BioY [Methanoplanus endosymbiosus]